jgi:hypothetical protein
MWEWFRNLYKSREKNQAASDPWKDLLAGDRIRVVLKNPESVGIAPEHRSLTFQRLDAEDIASRKLEGYVIRTQKIQPGPIETLEIQVVKNHSNRVRLTDYLLLREEIQKIEILGDNND